MLRILTAAIAAVALVSGCEYERGKPDPDNGRVMTREEFPCTQDEVLGWHPKFGPNHVGCIRARGF